MSPSVQRALRRIVLVLATLVVVGVFLQVYFIASYVLGAGEDALDLHEGTGGIVHGLELLVFLVGIAAFWKRWWDVGLGVALAVIGTVQLGVVEADEGWVAGLHGLLALLVLVIAAVISHRAVHALGLGRHGRAHGPSAT